MPPLGPVRGESPQDKTASQDMFTGWKHLQHALGGSLNRSVKRSRQLAQSRLKKGRL